MTRRYNRAERVHKKKVEGEKKVNYVFRGQEMTRVEEVSEHVVSLRRHLYGPSVKYAAWEL